MRYQSLNLFVFASYFVLNISAHAQSTEYELKAAYLFNLFSFVMWQEKAFVNQKTCNLCILGQHNFSQETINYLEKHNPKYNSDRQIRLFYLKTAEEAVTTYHCHLLFISQSEENNYLNILAIASLRPILTVGESEGFAALGGMIEFYKVDNKIKLRINKKIINWAGLTLRAKLLQISTIILDSSIPLPEKQFNFIDAPITFPETPQPQITFTPYISKTNEKEKALAKTPDFFSFDSEYFYNKSQLNQWVKETADWVVISLKIMVGIAILITIILLVKLWWWEKTR